MHQLTKHIGTSMLGVNRTTNEITLFRRTIYLFRHLDHGYLRKGDVDLICEMKGNACPM